MIEWLPVILITLLVLGLVLALAYIYRAKKPKVASEGLFFESHRGPIFYTIQGQGPSLLMVHGLGASSYCWRHNVENLQKDFRVITVDLWGFGRSSKKRTSEMGLDDHVKILIDLMDDLKIQHFHLLGHSMGGHICLWLARQYPGRVEKLVAVAPASHPKIAPVGLRKLAWIAHWTPLIVNRRFIRTALQREIKDPSLITDEVIDAYLSPYLDPDSHHSFAAAIAVLNDRRVYKQLEHIKCPVLLLLGKKDRVVKLKTIEQIHKRLPNSQLHTHETCHHLPMEEDPSWINDEVRAYLKS